MPGNIHIGTSGFYPDGLKPRDYLAYYAGRFRVTEINASFYRLPEGYTVESWAAQVPSDFLFCPKMSRYLTHMKKLREPDEPLARFFGVFEAVRQQLGPVLVQLPDRLTFKDGVAAHFYSTLRESHAGYRAVMEVRHPSWLEEASLQLMENFGIGLVVNQSGVHFPYSEAVTSGDVYLRFHGPRALYASSYSDEELGYYAGKIKQWTGEGRQVWAFFNNDIHGYAPVDAARLQALLA